jgi:stringent starvation protein B
VLSEGGRCELAQGVVKPPFCSDTSVTGMDSEAEKKERLLAALDTGLVMIHLDARRAGVAVPPHLKGESHLRLNLSYRFDPPDLSVGEWGVRATLSFAGKRFAVAVPWSALFAITSQVTKEFWMYPGDMPPELMQKAMDSEAAERADSPERTDTPARPHLQEVVPVEGAEDASIAPPVADAEKPRGRPHLRLVK